MGDSIMEQARGPAGANHRVGDLVAIWLRCIQLRDNAERELDARRVDLANTAQKLAEALAPNDLAPGEEIGLWCHIGEHAEAVVLVSKDHQGFFHLRVRG